MSTAALPLLLTLFMGGASAGQSRLDTRLPDARRVELPLNAASEEHEVAVRPGLTTVLRFHGASIARQGVVLDGHERVELHLVENLILLVPSERVMPGERLRLTVAFEDGDVPESTHFVLVVHTSTAERQVEVYRQRRSAESLRLELQAQGELLQRCLERVRQQGEEPWPEGLMGLFASGGMDATGVFARDISRLVAIHSEAALELEHVNAFRSTKTVMVVLKLWAPMGAAPWRATRAVLLDRGGEEVKGLTLWTPGPVPPGGEEIVVLEVPREAASGRGPFVVKLWGADGKGTITVRGVTFP